MLDEIVTTCSVVHTCVCELPQKSGLTGVRNCLSWKCEATLSGPLERHHVLASAAVDAAIQRGDWTFERSGGQRSRPRGPTRALPGGGPIPLTSGS